MSRSIYDRLAKTVPNVTRAGASTDKTGVLSLFNNSDVPRENLQVTSGTVSSERLTIPEAMQLVSAAFAPIYADRDSAEGLRLIHSTPDLLARFDATEAQCDRMILRGCSEGDLRQALTAHIRVILEGAARVRARRDRDREAAAMPDLPADTVFAAGLAFHDGKPGVWVRTVRQSESKRKDKHKNPPHTARNRGGMP